MKRKGVKKRCLTLLWRLLKRYLKNCSIHGLKYLVQEDCHWSERVFWFICCALSWWGCTNMVQGVLTDYASRPVATTIDTNYLGWDSYFPSLHFCSNHELYSKKNGTRIWKGTGNIAEIMDSTSWGYKEGLPEPHDSKTFADHADSSTIRCHEMFGECILNGERFNCCDIILPLWTPVGHCLVFNSIHTNPSDGKRIRLAGEGGGVFTINFVDTKYFKRMKSVTTIYVLDRLDLPTYWTTSERKVVGKWYTSEAQIDITQQPTYNEVGVHDTPLDKRYCRFTDETENLKIFKYYSYDVCRAEKAARLMLLFCDCVTHIYPRNAEMPTCNYSGLSCVKSVAESFTDTEHVQCYADCEEITFDFFTNFLDNNTDRMPVINVNLLFSPTIRYRRYIVHSDLDLVVAVGSAVGLFLGASVLSIVEIPYWFFVRSLDDEDEDDNRHRE